MLDAAWLRHLCLETGAGDVGFVDLRDPSLGEERAQIARAFPPTRSLISFVLRMNRENVRSPARSIANAEFHESTDETNHVARRITAALERAGVRALNPPAGFPMEADRWMTERMWVVAHKPVAVAAGLGRTLPAPPSREFPPGPSSKLLTWSLRTAPCAGACASWGKSWAA